MGDLAFRRIVLEQSKKIDLHVASEQEQIRSLTHQLRHIHEEIDDTLQEHLYKDESHE